MAIQRGLECEKSIIFVEITTSFQIARISTIFCASSCIIYEKIPFSISTIGNKPHVDIPKNAPLRACWKRVIEQKHHAHWRTSLSKKKLCLLYYVALQILCKYMDFIHYDYKEVLQAHHSFYRHAIFCTL